jgi:hypothetical protein
MQTTMLAPNLTSARAGDLLEIDGDTYILWSSCGDKAPGLACVTCSLRLANQGQLEMHIETGTHVVAAWCPRHGWEALS